MKTLRITALAAIAAMALLALVGVGSASAWNTTLCKTSAESPLCSEANRYPAGTSIRATTPVKMLLKNSTINVSCNVTMEGSIGSGNPLPITGTSWSFKNCTCPASFVASPSGSVSWNEGVNGTLGLSAGGGSPALHVNCFGFFDCVYSYPGAATFKGGNPAQLTIGETKLSVIEDKKTYGEVGCPAQTLTATTFEVTAPKPVYVAHYKGAAEPHSRLCTVWESGGCEVVNTYSLGTKLSAEALNFKIARVNDTVTCKKAAISGVTQEYSGDWINLSSVALSPTECSSNLFGSCTAVSENVSAAAKLGGTEGAASGSLFQFVPQFVVNFKCGEGGTKSNCAYNFGIALEGQFLNTEPALVYQGNELSLSAEEGWSCGKVAILTAHFTVTSPSPVFVA